MSRPICVECRVEYSCEKNEFLVSDPPSGGFEATYWFGDKWKCPGCSHQVVTGRGKGFLACPSSVGCSFEFNHSLPTEKKENVT